MLDIEEKKLNLQCAREIFLLHIYVVGKQKLLYVRKAAHYVHIMFFKLLTKNVELHSVKLFSIEKVSCIPSSYFL